MRASAVELPVSWTIHREVVLLLGWARAILLQFAHPLVAQGVRDHSAFRAGPLAPWRRLHGTLRAMLALTFGDEAEAARAIAGINAIHDRVHGRLPQAVGPFPAGTPYSARDPELLRWVHATCLDSFLLAYEVFVRPLTPAERDRYCAEAAPIETALGMPPGFLPRSAAELADYLARVRASGVLAVGDTARALARELLSPPGLRWLPPLLWALRLPAVGLLPPDVRAAYGLPWDARRAAALRALAALVRRVLPVLPPALRHWPRARRAARARLAAAAARTPGGGAPGAAGLRAPAGP